MTSIYLSSSILTPNSFAQSYFDKLLRKTQYLHVLCRFGKICPHVFFFFYIFFQLHSFEVSDYLSKPLTILHESLCRHTFGHFLFQ